MTLLRPCPQMEGYLRAEVASDTLVALSRNHFSIVMYEMQHHLRPLDLADEFVIVTLAKLANGNGRACGSSAAGPAPSGWPGAPLWSLSLSVSVLVPDPHRSHCSLFSSFSGPLLLVPTVTLLREGLSVSRPRTLVSLPLLPPLLQTPPLSPSEAQLSLRLLASLSGSTPFLSRSLLSWPDRH